MQESNLELINDDEELLKLFNEIFEENPKMVKQYQNGKDKVFRAIMNQIIKKSNNRVNLQKAAGMIPRLLRPNQFK